MKTTYFIFAMVCGLSTLTLSQTTFASNNANAIKKAQPISVTISPVNPQLIVGQRIQERATAYYVNGVTQDITRLATWSSDNVLVASVDAGGTISALHPGKATISAQFNDTTGKSTVS